MENLETGKYTLGGGVNPCSQMEPLIGVSLARYDSSCLQSQYSGRRGRRIAQEFMAILVYLMNPRQAETTNVTLSPS